MKEQRTNLIAFLAQRIKARAKADAKAQLELKDVNDVVVTFDVNDESEIAVGTTASPDGEYVFQNGKKIKVEGGVVTEIEEEQPAEPQADEKDLKIAELEAENERLKQEIETLKKSNEEVSAECEKTKKEMAKVNEFAKTLGYDEHKEYHAVVKANVADATGRPMFKYEK